MCGRYTVTVSMEELMMRYFINDTAIIHYAPMYNIAPMEMVPAIINDGSKNRLGELRWGLLPSWAKEDKNAGKMINARSETVLEKASFKRLIRTRRCIIPADGFYEWQKKDNKKQPMRIMMRDGAIFSMAGLYDIWTSPEGNKISTCTVITTAPNRLMADIHDRMPVILRPEDEEEWLKRTPNESPALLKLLKPYDDTLMRAYPVTTEVGNVRNKAKTLIEEIS